MRGAQQLYEADRGIVNLAEYMKAKDTLTKRQADMRDHIEAANAKAKKGTVVLHRKPNREWAGDMPKTSVPARTDHGAEQMVARGVTNRQAADAIVNPLKRCPTTTDDQGRKAYKSIGKDATVVVNPDTGDVVTAYKTKSRYRRKLEKEGSGE